MGVWQPLFQPYVPEWRDNLVLATAAPKTGTYIFRVSLGKQVWRQIVMPSGGVRPSGHVLEQLGIARVIVQVGPQRDSI